MKPLRLIIAAMAIIVSATVAAKDKDPENYHMRGILADGTEIEGYNETAFENFMFPFVTKVKLADTFGGETRTYTSDELKAVWLSLIHI